MGCPAACPSAADGARAFDRQRLMRDKIRNSRNYRSACTFDRQRLRPVKHRPQRLHPPEQLSEPRTHARRRRRHRLVHLFAMWGSRLPARAAGDSRSGSRSGSRQQIRKLASVRATSRRMRAAEASVAAMAISSSTPTQLHTPRLLAYARHTPAGSLPPCHHSSHSPGHHSSHAPSSLWPHRRVNPAGSESSRPAAGPTREGGAGIALPGG